MKMNFKYVLSFLIFVTTNSFADSISIEPMQKISTQVSTKEPNLIAVHNDKIVSMTANSGLIVSSSKTADGKVIFTTKSSKSFSIVIETENGFTFTLNVQPSPAYGGSSLTVYNKQAKGHSSPEQGEGQNTGYPGMITHVLTQIMNGKIPAGFAETRSAEITLPVSITQYLSVTGVNGWNSADFAVKKFRIRNITTQAIELNERYLWSAGVMAVSFYPNVAVINPGSGVDAYIVIREEYHGR